MKNLSVVLNAVLIVAVAILYFIQFSGHKTTTPKQTVIASKGSVVYVNIDTLLNNYKFANDLNETFLKKQEDSRTDFNFKAKKLEKEMIAFQRKLQNNGFLTKARAEEAQHKLIAKKQNLQQLEQKLSAELFAEQNANSKRLYDSVTNYLKLYNTKHHYSLILSTTQGGNVLFSQLGLDITQQIIDGLNKRYKRK